MRFLAVLFALVVFSIPVVAADLGGDCCVDLEERVAVVEDTTARKGNRKVSIKLFGYVTQNLQNFQTNYPLLATLNGMSSDELALALSRLKPLGHSYALDQQISGHNRFDKSALAAMNVNAAPLWISTFGNFGTRKDKSENQYGQKSFGFQAGYNTSLADNLKAGFSVGYARSNADFDDGDQERGKARSDQFILGSSVSGRFDSLQLGGNLTFSRTAIESTRIVDIAGIGDTAQSDQSNNSVSASIRLSQTIQTNGLSITPGIDLKAQWLHLDGYRETGAGAANLNVDGGQSWALGLAPFVELATGFQSAGWTISPYARVGVNFYNRNSIELSAEIEQFASLSGNIEFEKTMADIQAGLGFGQGETWNADLNYQGLLADAYKNHSISARVNVPF